MGSIGASSRLAVTLLKGTQSSGVRISQVPLEAPWNWLAAAWRDLWQVPRVGLGYGALFTAGALLMTAGLYRLGLQSLILALCGGFVLIGPLLAVGLYETSRRLAAGEAIELRAILLAGLEARGQLGFFGAVLLFAFFAWLQLAFLLFMLFLGTGGLPPVSEFVPTLLFTARGLGLLIAGTICGGVLAAVVFAISAISVPLLMVRPLDAVTAMSLSLEAVVRNPQAMALWAALIAAIMVLGLATLSLGLIVAFPLIGHATWHAFRDLAVIDGA